MIIHSVCGIPLTEIYLDDDMADIKPVEEYNVTACDPSDKDLKEAELVIA
jgi:hypothetical protein